MNDLPISILWHLNVRNLVLSSELHWDAQDGETGRITNLNMWRSADKAMKLRNQYLSQFRQAYRLLLN